MTTHNFELLPKAKKGRGQAWPVCRRCGLVLLKNAATQQAARQPCPGKVDPPPSS